MEVKVTLSKIDVIYLESLFLDERLEMRGTISFEEWVSDYIQMMLFDSDKYCDERADYIMENKPPILSRHPEAATDEETAYLFEK